MRRRLGLYRRVRAVLLSSRERNSENIILNCQIARPVTLSQETLNSDNGRVKVKKKKVKNYR